MIIQLAALSSKGGVKYGAKRPLVELGRLGR